MRFLIGLVPVLASFTQLFAQAQAPDAATLLMRAGSAVLTADTVRLEGTEFTQVTTRQGKESQAADFKLERSTGGRFRWELSSLSNSLLEISDGQYVWTAFSRSQTYTKALLSNDPRNDEFGRIKYASDPAKFHNPTIDKEDVLELRGQQIPCYVVKASYHSMAGNPGAYDLTRTVWIAKSNDQILRDIWDYAVNPSPLLPPSNVHVVTEYLTIEIGIELPAERFVFTPSPGMKMTGDDPAARKTPGGVRQEPGAALIHAVPPAYTPQAHAAGLQGTVSLYVEVNNDGHPSQVRVMQGLGLGLDEKAVEAVKAWEYTAHTGPANDVLSRIDVDVQFRLDPPGRWSVASEAYSVTVPRTPEAKEIVRPVPMRYQAPDSGACQSADRSTVKFTIASDGAPRDISGASDAAAMAVRNWRFEPATVNGAPAESDAEVEFECQPQGMILRSEIPPPPVYRVGGGVTAPTLLTKLEPEYSEEARREKLQGTVRLAIQVGAGGRAQSLRIVEPLGSGLDQKAMEAIKRWRFSPAMKDGKPVAIEATIEVNFRLL